MIAIRPARIDERDILEQLQWRASLANPNDRPHLEANPDAIDLPVEQLADGHVTVAEIDGQAVGFAVVLPDEGHLELDGLFVEPDRWRRGIGRALVDAVALEARRKRLALKVIANPEALGFYRRCGFCEVGMVRTRFGPGIRMARPG